MTTVPGINGRGTKKYSAPEVFVEGEAYDPFAADVYSLGVILHILITGYYPEKNELTFVAMKVDGTCLSILDGMLQKDPLTRMNINEVLSHQWFKKSNLLHGFKKKFNLATN